MLFHTPQRAPLIPLNKFSFVIGKCVLLDCNEADFPRFLAFNYSCKVSSDLLSPLWSVCLPGVPGKPTYHVLKLVSRGFQRQDSLSNDDAETDDGLKSSHAETDDSVTRPSSYSVALLSRG